TRLSEFPLEVSQFYRRAMNAYAIHEAAAWAFRLIDATNLHIAETTPWTLAKDPSAADRLTQVLFDAAEAIRLAAVLLEPIIPSSTKEILRRVGAPPEGLRLERDGRWRSDGERRPGLEGPLGPRRETDQLTSTAAGALVGQGGTPGAVS